ncbi:MAG: serine/threonine protein kinase [Gammaproteobacteria bacterium]|jgi:serine/threonine protein kinase|nr:serine/threonine protein kinase [Gammaproteobacteria bacterium]
MEPLLGSDPSSLGDYELLGRLGSGGFGVVYAATGSGGQKVAIKLLRPELSDDQTLRDRLAREGEALSRVGGQRNVKIHDVVTEGEFAYLVMDLVEGETLSDRVATNGPLAGPLLWFAAQGLVEALEDIHQAGIVHRDLKPSNVMYGPDGIKVLDFGISAVTDESALTQTGAFLATAAWISPEQVLGREVNEQSDIFNLGMVLAFAATGEHPFGTGRADAVMYRVTNTEPELENVPMPLREAVEMCLQRDPMERPSMETLKSFFSSTGASELETTNHEAGTVIVQPGRLASVAATTKSSEPLPTNDRKKKWLAPVVAVAAAAALVVGVLAIQQPSNSETATTQENPSSLNENNVDLSTDQLSFEVETTTTATAPSEETTTSAPLETTTTNAAETTTSTTSLPIESERLEENVLTANYTWGPSEETLSLQEVLGLEADGYYGEGTRDAHVAELAARGLSAMNVPDMPTVSNGLAPENLPEETTTTTTAPEYGPLIVVESVSPTDVSTGGTVSVVWTATRTGGVEESSVFSQASNAGDGYQTLFMNGSTSSLVPIQNGYRITSIFSIVASTNCGSWNVHLGADDYAGFPNTGVRNGAFNVSNCGAVSTTTTTAPSPPSTTTTTTPCESRHEVPNLVGLLTWQVAEIPWPSEPSCSPFIMREYQVQASGETIGGFFECDSVEPPIISQSLAAGTLYTIAELGSLGLDVYRQSCPT